MVYLVDTENVGGKWLALLEQLRENDFVLLLYTEHSPKFSFDDFVYMSQYTDRLRLVSCFNGSPNALDFQLCAMAGYLCQKYPDREYIVVSSDGGYDSMIHFLSVYGYSIRRLGVEELTGETVEPVHLVPKDMVSKEKVAAVLGLSVGNKAVTNICKFYAVNKHKKDSGRLKQMFHNYLKQEFGSDRGLVFYHKLKDSGLFDG